MTGRTPRMGRRPERGLMRLTDRDLWILEALGRMRFLTTTQLARLAFATSRSAANKRLRQLLNTGLVRVWVRDLAADNVYGLSEIGSRLLGPPPHGTSWPAPRGLDRQLDHLLLINDLRIAFILGLVPIGGELRWWKSDWELREAGRECLIPDALFRVGWNGAQAYALEVDNDTRAPRAMIGKILRYRALGERGVYGIERFITLIVGHDDAYLERCRVTLAEAAVLFSCYFTSFDKVSRHGILGQIWTSLDGVVSPTLPGLGTPPYCKEDAGSLSPDS